MRRRKSLQEASTCLQLCSIRGKQTTHETPPSSMGGFQDFAAPQPLNKAACLSQPMSAVRKLKQYLSTPEAPSLFQLKVTAGETWLLLTRTRPAHQARLHVRRTLSNNSAILAKFGRAAANRAAHICQRVLPAVILAHFYTVSEKILLKKFSVARQILYSNAA